MLPLVGPTKILLLIVFCFTKTIFRYQTFYQFDKRQFFSFSLLQVAVRPIIISDFSAAKTDCLMCKFRCQLEREAWYEQNYLITYFHWAITPRDGNQGEFIFEIKSCISTWTKMISINVVNMILRRQIQMYVLKKIVYAFASFVISVC